ncbi:hypothetical protein PYCC9005_002093 [Savitreella phatthalungensis]
MLLRIRALTVVTALVPRPGHIRSMRPQYEYPGPQALQFFFSPSPNATTAHEPINIIVTADSFAPGISDASDEELGNSTVALLKPGGLANWLRALDFADECLGLHLSTPAYANVDERGLRRLDFLYREDFGDWPGGTCRQTLVGGHHFRGWTQLVDDGIKRFAWLLAASQELDLEHHHDLVTDGYNRGRDEVVRRALQGGRDPVSLCHWGPAQVTYNSTLTSATSVYNHNMTTDGIISIIKVPAPECPL